MLRLQLRDRAMTPTELKSVMMKHLDRSAMALQVREACAVFKPSGERLLTYLPRALSEEACRAAYPFLHWAGKFSSNNRGTYGGASFKGVRGDGLKLDGTQSKTNYGANVHSVVAGAFDRYTRIPYCRQTILSTTKPEEWAACLPFIQEAAELFKRHVPDRYQAQLAVAKKTHPAYVIPKTPFTTLTINNCVAGTVHTDKGDYGPGFGVIAVLRRGNYKGGELIFPQYGAGADLQDTDVILFDAHEPHTNLPFSDQEGPEGKPEDGGWERISVVFYFRQKMLQCLSPAEELARAKSLGSFAEDDNPTDQT